jgi:deoxyribodipyrimidine photo-lyase
MSQTDGNRFGQSGSVERLIGLDRERLIDGLAEAFPDADRVQRRDDVKAMTIRGGRAAATARLAAIDPIAYARTRNQVDGAVTGLSPWIRHGVLSLAEVRDRALALVQEPREAAKFVSELGWRDYWRQVHLAIGDRIHDDIEPPAAAARGARGDRMPEDVLDAATGMHCIDAFVRRLHDQGWLHNHERMWLASWLVHVRRVRWQAGADWFLEHLLDADPASNHLSWQWIAGTFSAKPYIFNRENIEAHSGGVHCSPCPLLGRCDVEGDYDQLATRLFLPADQIERPPLRIRPATSPAPTGRPSSPADGPALVWLTLDSACEASPAAAANPDAVRVFVIDPAWLDRERPTLKRLAFLFECLADLPRLEVHVGDPIAVLAARARALACERICLTETPCPAVGRAVAGLRGTIPVEPVAWPQFCDRDRVSDLGRFSRYWSKVESSALRPTR